MDYKEHIRKKDGGLQAILSYKEDRKWKQKSKQGFEDNKKGEKQAKQWMHDMINDLENHMLLNKDYKNITFKEFIDIYVEDRKVNLSDSSLHILDTACRVNFNTLNHILLKDIKPIDVQRCVNKMVEKNLNSSTIESYLSKVHTVFRFAIDKYNIISTNPIKNIEYHKTKKEEKHALTKSEVYSLLKKIKVLRSKQYYITSLLAVKCGLRVGEILGLTWDNINFLNNTLKIDKQWNKKNGKFTFTAPKTKNSYREIPFSNEVKNELLEFKNNFPINIDNRILKRKSKDSFSSELIRTYKHVGFDISVHELRHTYATNLISNGMDFKTAAQLLGHDVEQTMKTYSHVNDDMLSEARKIINMIS
ncbi:tyrosine-type recombinase/integrase [Clostridium butyricum]|uniref:Tyrosine-type recombinase/integrase n=1 Tax=Clostridium butyricum TaxID=1492 RepID=A0A6L9EKG2_CLOBU|nr:tyrosine-type recombinase/integrase [Clostridium butyricum]